MFLREENLSIYIERGTDMISLTKMFQSHGSGKSPYDYIRTKRFKNLKKALQKKMNHASENNVVLVKIINGDNGGTWIHRKLIVDAHFNT